MLFIIQHQTSELWMKLMLPSCDAAMTDMRATNCRRLQMLARVQQDHGAAGARLGRAGHHDAAGNYSAIRPVPGPVQRFSRATSTAASGSPMGSKNARHAGPTRTAPTCLALVQAAFAPSLYDEALRLLMARRGLACPASHRARLDAALHGKRRRGQAWLTVYRARIKHWDLYQLGGGLTDLEDAFASGASAM